MRRSPGLLSAGLAAGVMVGRSGEERVLGARTIADGCRSTSATSPPARTRHALTLVPAGIAHAPDNHDVSSATDRAPTPRQAAVGGSVAPGKRPLIRPKRASARRRLVTPRGEAAVRLPRKVGQRYERKFSVLTGVRGVTEGSCQADRTTPGRGEYPCRRIPAASAVRAGNSARRHRRPVLRRAHASCAGLDEHADCLLAAGSREPSLHRAPAHRSAADVPGGPL
jgi:hypothetical protein